MITPLTKIDIVLSVFNQEKLIRKVLGGIFKNTTTPFNLILIFDGCTDKTEKKVFEYLKKHTPKLLNTIIIDHASNVYETKANNIGFKKAKEEYMLTLQDDMVINELGWERRLTYPLRKFDNVIAVTSRVAQDVGLMENLEGHEYFTNKTGRESNNLPRNIFAIRDTINRGPVAFNMKHLKSMNYLDESYAPSDLDDADLCLRAWREKKLICGVFWIDYISKPKWGKARAKDSNMYADNHIPKNATRLKDTHQDYIKSQIKHSEDIIIPESEIDYC
ncbi:MAG TPA: glycosyltransferase family A protein [Candidatus Paceibacterota bacterium]